MVKGVLQRQITLSFVSVPEHAKNVLQFSMESHSEATDAMVTNAELFVMIKHKRGKRRGNNKGKKRHKKKRISLNVLKDNGRGVPQSEVASLRTKIKKSTWLKIGLPLSMVQKFIINNRTLSLHVVCTGCTKQTRLLFPRPRKQKRMRSSLSPRNKRKHSRPFMIIHTWVNTTKYAYSRRKRSASGRVCSGRRRCCKQDLYMDFAELGWNDWILFPRGYTTGNCIGRCNLLSPILNSTNIPSNVRSCVPSKSKHLSLIYIDNNDNLISSIVPNIVTTQCRCRYNNFDDSILNIE